MTKRPSRKGFFYKVTCPYCHEQYEATSPRSRYGCSKGECHELGLQEQLRKQKEWAEAAQVRRAFMGDGKCGRQVNKIAQN